MASITSWATTNLRCGGETRPTLPGCCSFSRTLQCKPKRVLRLTRIVRQADNDEREVPPPQEQEILPERREETPKPKKKDDGEVTARITGALAVLLGIAYLALVQILERRGGSLEPPPPEAYLP
ncbi:uncharacterized protein LOC112344920 [Selaginella moellendorffii]|uniref:uncharacterized protein LOC112344920 n=1 Tax=Selaginella moellendorffii TaxID=88036 RepID=UPI000D1C6815|nr:uncharacterized protein LOC112344920 [Selaginella moellendorffii]|eukprot:XP_024526274.1 uncharacterized protein LOC112344920 [Selaginella moellendorffii]